MCSWHRRTCWREKSSPSLSEISMSAPAWRLSLQTVTLKHFEKTKTKNKCQKTFCCWLQRNVPGYDAIVRLCWDICQVFASYFSMEPHWYLSSLCQHSGQDIASRVNDEQGEQMVFVVIWSDGCQPCLCHWTTAYRQDGRPLHSCRLMMTFCKMTSTFLHFFWLLFFLVRTNLFLQCCLVK